jgi:CHAT domain-containing protein
VLAESLDPARHPEAIEAADAAGRWLEGRGEWARVMAVKARLGRWRIRHGQQAAGQADLERVIALSAQVQQAEPDLRVAHVARSTAAAYEGLIEQELRQGGAGAEEKLLVLAEERWRQLDFAPAAAPPPQVVALLKARLRPDAAVLCLLPLQDRLLGWVIRKDAVYFRPVDVGRAEMDGMVKELDLALRRSDPGAMNLARSFGERVVGPFAARIGPARRVFVVAAGALASVPFAWLPDAGGQPLGRRWEISMAPSLGYLAAARPPDAGRGPRFLAVGFAGEGPDLPPLPSAQAEAEGLARRLQGDTLLGHQATPEAMLRLLPGTRTLHFAGHAVGHAERPGLSSLVLAGPEGRAAYLTANEIARADLGSLRLAVLAACQAAATTADYTEGGVSLARAFLAAGARTVVGPLWAVSDPEMKALSAVLYTDEGGLNRKALMPDLPFDQVGPGIKAMIVFSAEGALVVPAGAREEWP